MTNYLTQLHIKLFLAFIYLCFSVNSLTAKEYIIGVEEVSYYPLYDFSAQDTSRPSFTKELLTAFFEHHHYQYRFLALPVKRFDKWYIERSIDFKFPDNFRWREDTGNSLGLSFSEPVVNLMAGSYMLKSRQYAKRDEVKKLGTIFGFSPTLWSDKIDKKQLELVEESSPFSVIKHVLRGNVDATNIDGNVIRYNLKKLKNSDELVLNETLKHEIYSYHFSSIKYPEIIQEFNVYLKNNEAFLKQLKVKYDIKEDF